MAYEYCAPGAASTGASTARYERRSKEYMVDVSLLRQYRRWDGDVFLYIVQENAHGMERATDGKKGSQTMGARNYYYIEQICFREGNK